MLCYVFLGYIVRVIKYKGVRQMKCSVCGKRVKSIFRDGSDYFYRECDTCHEVVCEHCSDEDDNGKVECTFCITDRLIKEGVIKI